ncbi:MAG: STELLO glycosyltransferase family protein [Candidatus Methylacidiphilales bacterium]|nr:STELLO glycosyltransferase family protein [Candidatus Methylacidiphilales bacterium]
MDPIPFGQGALVVTSISAPNPVLRALAQGAAGAGCRFIVAGDTKSPDHFLLPGCEFLSVDQQRQMPFQYAGLCPTRSYTRKNIAYLAAIAGGARFIVETDDDNFPRPDFWAPRNRLVNGDAVEASGWVNVYGHFADDFIYPRGYPLDGVRSAGSVPPRLPNAFSGACPIQQGLADENPDVDAVYRMLYPLPFNFRKDRPMVLQKNQWCPFNSQNTTFFPEVYPLLYLPAHCSFRMTDIWRSFVAQRILWTCGWGLSFHSATVWQERNEHSLIVDFRDEVPGYLHNRHIAEALERLDLPQGPAAITANIRACYGELIAKGWIGPEEMDLLDAWLKDLLDLPGHSSFPQKAGDAGPASVHRGV